MVGYVQCELMKNVTCVGYICSRTQLIVQVFLLCALMKNDLRTQYICSTMKLSESSFSMCIDEKCCTYWIYTRTECAQFFLWDFLVKSIHNVNKSSIV